MIDAFRGRSVLVTGPTGFKGSWLCLWLSRLGARVTGLSLPAAPGGLFERAAVGEALARHIEGDIREPAIVDDVVLRADPDFVFHLAAQSLVRASYDDPAGTFATNAQGTAHVLDAVRRRARQGRARPCAVVCVTTDKCYENPEHGEPMREDDRLGGRDPYSASKAAAELIVASYRSSFFPPERIADHGVRLASARAGNVLGGGDFATDRIVPDLVRALAAGERLRVRNPESVRPWQHVLDPLHGYLQLATALAGDAPPEFCTAFNFGPDPEGCTTVRELVARMLAEFGAPADDYDVADAGAAAPYEARLLRLATDKARRLLGWRPAWGFEATAARTAGWYRRVMTDPAHAACASDLDAFQSGAPVPRLKPPL